VSFVLPFYSSIQRRGWNGDGMDDWELTGYSWTPSLSLMTGLAIKYVRWK